MEVENKTVLRRQGPVNYSLLAVRPYLPGSLIFFLSFFLFFFFFFSYPSPKTFFQQRKNHHLSIIICISCKYSYLIHPVSRCNEFKKNKNTKKTTKSDIHHSGKSSTTLNNTLQSMHSMYQIPGFTVKVFF